MVRDDPYTPERGYFECRDCNNRVTASDHLTDCPECGSNVHNIAVARE